MYHLSFDVLPLLIAMFLPTFVAGQDRECMMQPSYTEIIVPPHGFSWLADEGIQGT